MLNDFPAPDVAKTTQLALGRLNLSKIINDSFWEFIPYKTPVSLDSSVEVKGNDYATLVVSIFLVIFNLSIPKGAVELFI